MPFVSGWKDSTANSVSGRTSGIPGSYRPQGRVSFQVDVTTRAGSRQSRDSSRLSDDPTSWSGTTRLRWSRPGARFKRQAWSDIWCRPRLCRGPEVWGTRTYDESAMFEALTLGVFEVGLSWSIVFGKRDAFRKAFRGFDVAKVAAMTELAKSYAITRKGAPRSIA